jgi:hypothetical protein
MRVRCNRTARYACIITLAISISACARTQTPSQSTSAASGPQNTLAVMAENQRSCIGLLRAHLAGLGVTRIDAFLSRTLNGLEVCDADYGLAHLPTREVSKWLDAADGKRHPQVHVPEQPAEISQLPRDGEARVRYQRACIAWMDRFLPADIANTGDDPDTAAADVFNGIEECDAVAGFATISRDDLAKLVKSKNLQ